MALAPEAAQIRGQGIKNTDKGEFQVTQDSRDQAQRAAWFVGASFDHNDDQTARFLREGIWENGYDDQYLDLVRSMKPGDNIVIKAAYVRKNGLPFDNGKHFVSVMAIKAVGVVTANMNDGKRVRVDWKIKSDGREWFFYTGRGTVWRVTSDQWKGAALLAFALDGQAQDIDRFRNAPYWRERFGDADGRQVRFQWTKFYEAIATGLIEYRNNRPLLVAAIRSMAQQVDVLGYLENDAYTGEGRGFVRDICPFTVMGMFNRGIKESSRKKVAGLLAAFLKVTEPVPASFEGIPILNNLKSWFFPFESERDTDQIDALWAIFAECLELAAAGSEDDEATRARFAQAFDKASTYPLVKWNLTMGLYWARPWDMLSLDSGSQTYISKKLGLKIGHSGPARMCSASEYLGLVDTLKPRFDEANYPVHSFPELSLEAWGYTGDVTPPADELPSDDASVTTTTPSLPLPLSPSPKPFDPYTVADVVKEGCFLDASVIEGLVHTLRGKKNLILQGPPGTGKTWLGKRLAYALMGKRDETKLRVVQFHPNLSYEDFVRGWRPSSQGKLEIADGVFMEAVKAAAAAPGEAWVVVIEEVNRGNPAQIFGEMLTLLEADKRTPKEAIELTYPDVDNTRKPVHIPENLYVIGTMNIADRSLALVDLALRRRFAFATLEPQVGSAWREWVTSRCGIEAGMADEIALRINGLNKTIRMDERLGKQFRVGHSYVTPVETLESGTTRQWFRRVVDTEIAPLLEEYWFDEPSRAQQAVTELLHGW